MVAHSKCFYSFDKNFHNYYNRPLKKNYIAIVTNNARSIFFLKLT